MNRVLITGTSQGLGKALATEFPKSDYEVIATARNPEDIPIDGIYKKLALDVTQPEMIENVISGIGPIDILINNAGISISGPAEVIPQTDVRQLFEVNFFGAVKMMKAVIPQMRMRGAGIIVNISSPASQLAPPYGSFYAASKAALELVSEELRFELRPFGIEVLVMQCGAIDTQIAYHHPIHQSETYAGLDQQMIAGFEHYQNNVVRPSAQVVARQIIAATQQEQRPFKTVIGNDAAYLLDLRKKMSDSDWEATSPFTKNIRW